MRTFEFFPQNIHCPICGTRRDTECTLIPIEGTEDGLNCEAQPVHTDCLKQLRFNKEQKIVYAYAEKRGKNDSILGND